MDSSKKHQGFSLTERNTFSGEPRTPSPTHSRGKAKYANEDTGATGLASPDLGKTAFSGYDPAASLASPTLSSSTSLMEPKSKPKIPLRRHDSEICIPETPQNTEMSSARQPQHQHYTPTTGAASPILGLHSPPGNSKTKSQQSLRRHDSEYMIPETPVKARMPPARVSKPHARAPKTP